MCSFFPNNCRYCWYLFWSFAFHSFCVVFFLCHNNISAIFLLLFALSTQSIKRAIEHKSLESAFPKLRKMECHMNYLLLNVRLSALIYGLFKTNECRMHAYKYMRQVWAFSLPPSLPFSLSIISFQRHTSPFVCRHCRRACRRPAHTYINTNIIINVNSNNINIIKNG